MDENLTSVNAEQVSAEGSQTEPEQVETATNEGESAVVVEQQTETTTEKPAERPKQTPEENAQYKALRLEERQRAVQEALAAEQAKRDAKIAANGWSWNGKPITTEAEYESALAEKNRLDALMAQGDTEADAMLKLELERLKNQLTERETAAQKAQREQQEYIDLFDYFKTVNGRAFDIEKDVIPPEVFVMAKEKGVPLTFAYSMHRDMARIKTEAELKKGSATAEANAKNAASSVGSVTGNGAADAGLTEEMIANMTPKQLAERWNDVKKTLNMK